MQNSNTKREQSSKLPKTGKNPWEKSGGKGRGASSKAGENDSAKGNIGFHFLGSFTTLPLLKLAANCPSEEFQDVFSIIDTEQKQLQAIEDLYYIVKAQPKYKNLKEPVWDKETSPIDVLYWLLRKLGPLAKGNQWTIDTYQDRGRLRYRFVVYKHYNFNKLKDREEHLPIDFLPFLHRRDKPLHDLIIDILALVSRENKIPFWDEDGDFSAALSDLKAMAISGNSTLQSQLVSYKQGPAATYLVLLKRRRKIVTERSVAEMIGRYVPNSQRKRSMLWWIKLGLKLAKGKDRISNHTYIPNYINGNPISPFRLYKFVWSLHDNDILKIGAYKKMDSESNAGWFGPVMFHVAKPGQKICDISDYSFPVDLYEFMRAACANVRWQYKDYYYRNLLNEKQTPAEKLLQSIELSEIKSLLNE